MTGLSELFAQQILRAAITEHRAAEMIEALFDGGSVTVDPAGRLQIATADQIRLLAQDMGAT